MPFSMKSLYELQVPRSLLVGAIATGVDFAFLVLLVRVFGVSPQVASVPCLVLGSLIQFFGNRHFALRAGEGGLGHQILGFAAAEVGALAVNAYVYYALLEYGAMSYALARPIASALTFFGFSFPVWKWVFRVS